MKKFFLITLFLSLFVQYGISQTYVISTGGTVTTCAGDFYDSGQSGNYGNNENFTMTFHSPGPPNTHMLIAWNSFDVDPSDTLYVHDGPTIASPLIGAYNNNNLPGFFTQATVFNSSGDLTFHFKSNGTITTGGWWGGMLCGPVCQTVISAMDTAACVPPPNDSNYIDICIGDWIHFAALTAGPGAFPQNDTLYHQGPANCTFDWDFGDGFTGTGPVVDHLYTLVRGYDVTLTITDSMGCTNSNALGLRVRISANPFAEVHPIPDICSNIDTTFITLGYSLSSSIIVAPITSQQEASQKYDSITFIPDGPLCPPGFYNTYVTFNDFAPGAMITSSADVLSVVVSMEHSFAGDIGFTLFCPNGQSVVLDGNDHSGGSYLGVPWDGAPYDSDTYPCDPAYNTVGTPWIYGWSQIYPQQGSLNTLDGLTSPIPATDTVNHINYFTPDQSFANLIGCPLNGQWNIRITDDWQVDNGYIFMWQLNLDPSLLPTGWGYSVPIDTVIWSGSFFNVMNDSTIMVIPDSSGTFQYTVTVYDVFGCSYDTNLFLQVVQTPEVDLGHDTIICGNGVIYNLDAGPGNHYQWSTMSNTNPIPVTSTGLYSVTVENYNNLGTLTCADADTVFVKVLAEPFVDLGPDICNHDPVVLNAQNNGFHYLWNTGDTTQSITVTETGNYSVSVAEEYGYNCESVSDINVTIFPILDISIGPDSTICRHQTIQIVATDAYGNLSNYPYTITWSPFSPTSSNSTFLALSWLQPETYSIICQITGCETYADTMQLTVESCPLDVPNIFTPNGDGHNETFDITNLEFYPNSTMVIFNRWGRKVYENNNYQGDWNGENCADGVYYYILTVNMGDHGNGLETEQQHGMVTILR